MNNKTDQEEFWAGTFGDEYTQRNVGSSILASNIALFSKIMARVSDVNSIIEFGSNLGLNLMAIKAIMPNADLSAIEINDTAVKQLEQLALEDVFHQSILDFKPNKIWDLVLIKGVMIHLNPDRLHQAYQSLYDACGKWMVIAEYYNPTPVEIKYRGHAGKLFKRDFAGEMMDKYPDLKLIDYGFVWHRDNNYPQDDISWFLLKKE